MFEPAVRPKSRYIYVEASWLPGMLINTAYVLMPGSVKYWNRGHCFFLRPQAQDLMGHPSSSRRMPRGSVYTDPRKGCSHRLLFAGFRGRLATVTCPA